MLDIGMLQTLDVHLMSPMTVLASRLTIPFDQLTAALCLVLAFPCAFLLHWHLTKSRAKGRVPNRWVTVVLAALPTHLLFFLAFCVFRYDATTASKKDLDARFQRYLWDLGAVHAPALGTWMAVRWSTRLRTLPTLVFAGVLGLVAYHHLHQQWHFYNEYAVNVCGPLMVLAIKLSSFAYDVYDGRIAVDTVSADLFYGWCFLFGGFFTGPVPSFGDYRRFVEAPTCFFARDTDAADLRALRGRKRRASFLVICAAGMVYASLIIRSVYPHHALLAYVEAREHSVLQKMVHLHLSMGEWRLKYYIAWMLAEAALVIVGLGYRADTARPQHILWDRLQNVNPIVIETTCDFRTIIAEWNVTTNHWLNTYVYQRLGRTFVANLATYLVSAFWHGFYPGYYVTFVSGALYTALCRGVYRRFTWPWSRRLRHVLLWAPNYLIVDYFMVPFSVQTWCDSWRFMRAVGWYGHVAVLGGLALMVPMGWVCGGRRAPVSHKKVQ